jgi:hypothetical protein
MAEHDFQLSFRQQKSTDAEMRQIILFIQQESGIKIAA